MRCLFTSDSGQGHGGCMQGDGDQQVEVTGCFGRKLEESVLMDPA